MRSSPQRRIVAACSRCQVLSLHPRSPSASPASARSPPPRRATARPRSSRAPRSTTPRTSTRSAARRSRHGDAGRQLAAVLGAGGRPELLLLRHRRPLQHQDRQRRRRQRRRRLPVDVQGPLPQPDTFLYNNGPVTSLNDENLNYYQTYKLVRIDPSPARPRRSSSNEARRARRTSARRPCPTTRRCATQATRPPAKNVEVVRRPGRGPVLPRPAGLRPALRRRPLRGRRRHARRLQRPVGGAPGAAAVGREERRTPRRTRSSASGRRRDEGVNGKFRPGLAPGQPAGQRGRHPAQGQGHVQRLQARRSDGQFLQLRHQPRAAQGDRGRLRHRRAQRRRATTSCRCSSPGVEGLNQPKGRSPRASSCG